MGPIQWPLFTGEKMGIHPIWTTWKMKYIQKTGLMKWFILISRNPQVVVISPCNYAQKVGNHLQRGHNKKKKSLRICTLICYNNSWIDQIQVETVEVFDLTGSCWVPTRCSPPCEGSPAPMTGSRYNKPAGEFGISAKKKHHLLQTETPTKTLAWSLEQKSFWSIELKMYKIYQILSQCTTSSCVFLKPWPQCGSCKGCPGAANQKWSQWTLEQQQQKPWMTFHYTDWLIGILISWLI